MTENERDLIEGLKALAAEGPQEARPLVEQRLLAGFRARAARRRRVAWGYSTAAFAALAAMIVMFFVTSVPRTARPDRNLSSQQAFAASDENTLGARLAVVRTDDLAASFYPLPEAEYLPPLETTLVVRVQLPVSSLRLMGVPLEIDDLNPDPVQADVLMGQDGLARGVRLIQ